MSSQNMLFMLLSLLGTINGILFAVGACILFVRMKSTGSLLIMIGSILGMLLMLARFPLARVFTAQGWYRGMVAFDLLFSFLVSIGLIIFATNIRVRRRNDYEP